MTWEEINAHVDLVSCSILGCCILAVILFARWHRRRR